MALVKITLLAIQTDVGGVVVDGRKHHTFFYNGGGLETETERIAIVLEIIAITEVECFYTKLVYFVNGSLLQVTNL